MGRAHHLTEKHKQARLEKAQKLLDFLNEKPGRLHRVLFTDEKIFPIGRYLNRQNHRQILSRATRYRRWRIIGHTQFPKSVMIWAGVSGIGKTKLRVIERGVKINSAYYQLNVLKKRAKPDGQKIFGRKQWWFQQDWAPAHGSKSTLAFCNAIFNGRYWDKTMWPSNSPDLNPLDFSIWGLVGQRLGKRRFKDIKQLKKALNRVWSSITSEELKNIVEEFPRRLQACIQAKGGHFEHLLK
jgi:hypothetical protein